ncbi:cation-transporting P-type ATPase [Micromonospora orduensis]|uniref:Cation-transporting P-type ATPase n=1 Tax=Micromonospora orduensis TaxID=1420891 RepID=A0A5C4QYK1_9ACTN|nr:cation-transporting P-type ATPase [Micromonospora orduensis]TNH31129.1 cation-transporting P-type ATPase [Micromonospora orduensis]
MTATIRDSIAPPSGLTVAEVAERRRLHGPNQLPEPKPRSLASRVLAQLRDPLVVVLLAAMVVTALLRDITDLIVIGLVIVLNTTVGVVQEVRADRAVAALRRLAAPYARVVRDGAESMVAAADLVPDDVVRLEAGDVVPADLTLIEAVRLTVDEAALTGESVPVAKEAGGGDAETTALYAGTVASTGRAVGVVTRTGAASALGRIAALVAAQPHRATPLQRRLAGLGRAFALAAAGLSLLVLAVGLARGLPLADMVLAAVSLTVAAVPESLPAVVTVALALGARRMARRSAIVRRLPAVETLGSVTVIAADKTGTLTEGVMSVDRFVCADGTEITVSGHGYDPESRTSPRPPFPAAADLARAILLCNDAHLAPPTEDRPRWAPVGDPMEAALVTAAARCGVDVAVRSRYPRVAEAPFDATRRRMTTLHQDPDGGYLVVCKGAPEVLLATGGPLVDDPATRERAATAAAQLAAEGYRVLAVAQRHTDDRPEPEALETRLRLLGLVALMDPVRAEAANAVEAFAGAGIRLILITGDHPSTAAAIAARLGMLKPGDTVAVGDDVDAGLVGATVYARTRPEQKLTIVQGLQADGAVVAMTGDGVNDAPALRRADIGVAMGRGGTEAARQAADLVLADDNLATVAVAVAEGRRIYANIRRFLVYALSGGLAEVLVMLIGPFVGLTVPLLPAQILWINMITHGLPGVALGAEPADPDVMNRPPRRPDQAIIGGLAWRIAGTGGLIATVSLVAALVAAAADRPWQSVLFTVLGLAQLGVALALRVRGRDRNWALDAAVALSLALQLTALWLPPLRTLLGTEALSLTDVAACAAAATIPATVTLLTRRRRTR